MRIARLYELLRRLDLFATGVSDAEKSALAVRFLRWRYASIDDPQDRAIQIVIDRARLDKGQVL